MGRKAKYSKEFKLNVVNKYFNGQDTSTSIAHELKIHPSIINEWINEYRDLGEEAFKLVGENNNYYTKEFKEKVVLEYLNGNMSYKKLANKHRIPSHATIIKWVNDYNSHIELKDYIPGGKEIYMTKSRKVTVDERIKIAKYCIEHGLDYKTTAKVYETTYANVFNWVKKYRELGEEGLTDKRGRHKTDDEVSEIELLKRQLKKMEHERDMALLEVDLLKKLDEIERRRFTEQANMKSNMKRLKK